MNGPGLEVDDPRQWLKPMLQQWRKQQLRALRGYHALPDGYRHYDGWPPASPMSRVMTQMPPKGHFFPERDQQTVECFTGDGLRVRRAMEGMPFAPRLVLYSNLLSELPVRRQFKLLHIPSHHYFAHLSNAHFWLAARIAAEDERESLNQALRALDAFDK
jgi:hypothetical protein